MTWNEAHEKKQGSSTISSGSILARGSPEKVTAVMKAFSVGK
jgi:hypothetical protein